ncbi:MAGE family-domain-containing protein [Coniochaeta sp. 2T2.1]|nr:MAGE family-domain-containing protein [Coniochaeta sp. 2T2.1]
MAPGRRRRDADDEDAEDEQPQNRRKSGKGRRRQESDNESGEDSDAGDRAQNRSADTELRLAHKLVRYAIACEHSRTPVRREAVREKVYAGDSMRSFRNVYELAQIQLRTVFGMQLVEQPSKDRSLLSLDQKRKAAKSQKSTGPATKASTNTWILTTILPAPFRTPAIIAPSKVHSSEGEASYAGLYTLLIALITLSGGELRDAKFHQYLGRLNVETTVPSNNPNNRHQPSEATEVALQRMIRQGYLVKQVGGEDNEDANWYVGPRGKVEVDNEAIAAVVRRVYGEAGGVMLEKQLSNSLGVTARLGEDEEVDGEVDAEGDEDEQGEEGPPRQRQRVNTLGRASPMAIRSRQEDGDPGPSSRRSGRLRA